MSGPATESGLRLRVSVETFAGWRQAGAGLPVPAEFAAGLPPSDPSPDDPRQPIPPFVAASFAVHAHAEVSVCLRLDDGSARVDVCLSVSDGLAAVLARATPGGWVQVGLLPVEAAVPEVVSWVPDAAEVATMTSGSLQVLVAAADDAVALEFAHWIVRGGGWHRVVLRSPGPAATQSSADTEPVTPADLAVALTAVLARSCSRSPR